MREKLLRQNKNNSTDFSAPLRGHVFDIFSKRAMGFIIICDYLMVRREPIDFLDITISIVKFNF